MLFGKNDDVRATAVYDLEDNQWSIYVNPFAVTTAEEYLSVRDDLMAQIAARGEAATC